MTGIVNRNTSNVPAVLSRRSLLRATGTLGAVAATSGLLAACSSSSGGGTTGGSKGGKPARAPMELPADVSGPLYPDGYVGPRARELKPFSDGSKTFKVVVPQSTTVIGDWNKNDATAWFQKQTGVKVEFQQIDTSDTSKLNAILASGDLPDAFLGVGLNTSQLSLYGQQGLFAPLDDLIKTYAPRARDMMKAYPELRSLLEGTDGKLYTFPTVNDCYHCHGYHGRAFVSKTYLDKVGMPMPQTTDELRQVLLEFKNKNPSGKKGFMPLLAGASLPLDPYFMQSFCYNPGSPNYLRMNNGKVEFVANSDGWRNGLRYLNQLGKDGLITAQTFALTPQEVNNFGNTHNAGFVCCGAQTGFFTAVNTSDPKAIWRDYIAAPPVKGPDGTRIAQWNYYTYQGVGLAISSKCSSPETMVQWADAQLDLKSVMIAYGGVEGKNWDWAKKGTQGIDGKQAIWSSPLFPAPVGQSWWQFSDMYRSLDFRNGEEVNPKSPTDEKALYEAGVLYAPYKEPQDQQVPPLILSDADAAQAADTSTSIAQQVSQGLSQFSLGKLDPNNDRDWKTYTEAFAKMNVPAFVQIYQRAYDKRPK